MGHMGSEEVLCAATTEVSERTVKGSLEFVRGQRGVSPYILLPELRQFSLCKCQDHTLVTFP